MTLEHVRDVVQGVRFMDRRFVVLSKGDGYLLQVQYMEADVDTGVLELQKARKWYISQYATESEIVETAYAACVRSMQHIVGEHFTYRGRRVYSPHFEVWARIALCDGDNYDERQPPLVPEIA